MRVVKLNTLQEEPLGEATPIAGWTGGSVTRTRQTIIPITRPTTIAVASSILALAPRLGGMPIAAIRFS